ncbi:MAG: NADH-quinone oxidoreductase subunit K [Chlamydiia bacterium]|nr:NADH-quinone oxidoreductase subunit K [Chlamydiia bacterium]
MSILSYLMLSTMVGVSTYFILSRYLGEVILGITMLSNAINILLILSSHKVDTGPDPLPQALILTAIVIGFALVSLFVAYVLNRVRVTGSDEVEGRDPC